MTFRLHWLNLSAREHLHYQGARRYAEGLLAFPRRDSPPEDILIIPGKPAFYSIVLLTYQLAKTNVLTFDGAFVYFFRARHTSLVSLFSFFLPKVLCSLQNTIIFVSQIAIRDLTRKTRRELSMA